MDELEIQAIVALARARGYNSKEIKAELAKHGVDWEDTDLKNPANIGRELVSGATFDFADEIIGALPFLGGEEGKKNWRKASQAFRKDHPVASTAANVAGGFVVPGGGAAKFIKGAKTIKGTFGRGAALGATAGAAAGIGAAEGDLGERADEALYPAIAGGILGGAIPGLPGALRAAVDPSKRAAARFQGAINRSGGTAGLQARLKDFVDAGRGAEVTAADLSKPMRQTTDFAANASEEAAEAVENVVLPRQATAPNRLLDDVTSKAGNPHADDIVSDLETGTAAWADGPAGYGGLRAKNPVIVPAMAARFQQLLMSPPVRSAWQQAQEVGLIGPMPQSGSVSFDVMQGTLERLGTAKKSAFNRGANDLGFRLKAAEQAMKDEMEVAVPGFKRIAAEYAERKGLERAVRRGEELYMEDDTRGLAKEIAGMSKDEVMRVRQGMASKMIAGLRKAATNRDEAKRLVNRSAAMEDKIRVIFGDRATFERFIKQAETEAELAKLLSTITGSQTARRTIAQAADPAGIAATAATGHPGEAVTSAIRSQFPKVIASKTGRELAPLLMTQGSPAIEQLLKTWGMRPALMPGWASKMAPVGAGVGAANLFD
jgi:hypothetical protein